MHGQVAIPQGKGARKVVFQPSTETARDIEVETCDVCIAGADVGGLNALFVASQSLSRD
jgi:hypothetical protein